MAKAYKGLPMEGVIATWYAKNTAADLARFRQTARVLSERLRPGGDVLEVAPGPGYLAIELAKRGYSVTALDISKSFVEIARDNADRAGVPVDVCHGDAADMPFSDASFDLVVCMAAFKNFSDPIGAIDEMHRVLKPGGQAFIFDLRKDATSDEIDAQVRQMRLSAVNTYLTRWTFQLLLLKRAYTRAQLQDIVAQSRFSRGDIAADGIGFELRLSKENSDRRTSPPAALTR